MAIYKPIRKTASGTEEIKIPYAVLADPPTIPTKTSGLTNDSGFITSDGTVKSVVDYGDTSKNIKIGYYGAGITGGNIKYIAGYTTGDGTTGNVARIKDISKDALKTWLGYATVATSGSYNDLADTPAIPAAVTESTVSGWGFTKNTGTVTSVAVKMNDETKGTVTSSGTIDLGTVITAHQDISGKANLSGGNTFTGKQTLNSPASDGYSINAAGYIKGSWLQASSTANKGSDTGKVCVFDGSGWIYYRTPSEILSEASGVPKSAFSLSGTTLTITV